MEFDARPERDHDAVEATRFPVPTAAARPVEDQPPLVAFVGISAWKQQAVRQLLTAPRQNAQFFRLASQAVNAALQRRGAIGVWPSKAPKALDRLAAQAGTPLVRLEDGFLRSNGLGAEFRAPLSLIADRRGIHFDPSIPSDLEDILTGTHFGAALTARATRLVRRVVDLGLTKYNLAGQNAPPARGERRTVLVAGQVEDDLSFRLGGAGITSNMALLARARQLEPDAVLLYKPHPDVEAGLRKGGHAAQSVMRFADGIVGGAPLPALFAAVDAIHVLTSLTGFEALLRGLEVVVHGQPFYSGWGLTRDLSPPPRRGRRLSVAELAAGALILYPRYLDPLTGQPCPPEQAVERLAAGAGAGSGLLTTLRRVQGLVRKAAFDPWAA